jgi:hypothetical protein
MGRNTRGLDAVKSVMPFIQDLGTRFRARDNATIGTTCNVIELGNPGSHFLCDTSIARACNFIGFGIANDYSFESELAEKFHCNGFHLPSTPQLFILRKRNLVQSGEDPRSLTKAWHPIHCKNFQ